MPDGVRMRISSLLAVVMVLLLLECRWYTAGTMDTLVSDDLAAGDGQKLSVVAYGALLAMVLRGASGAVRRLEGEGTLERQRGGALVVRPYSMETFLHALAVRRLLEGEAARLAAGKIAPSVIADARARIARLRDEGLADVARQDDRDFHAAIAAASGNPVLATTI